MLKLTEALANLTIKFNNELAVASSVEVASSSDELTFFAQVLSVGWVADEESLVTSIRSEKAVFVLTKSRLSQLLRTPDESQTVVALREDFVSTEPAPSTLSKGGKVTDSVLLERFLANC
jgi:hypothetical protein